MGQGVTMKTETHFFDAKRENSVFQTKLELMKSDGEMIRENKKKSLIFLFSA